jgi:hypothetical protein
MLLYPALAEAYMFQNMSAEYAENYGLILIENRDYDLAMMQANPHIKVKRDKQTPSLTYTPEQGKQIATKP